MGTVADAIRMRLTEAFQPQSLEVIDDSDRHSGHSGTRESGESHFTVKLTSAVFTGLSRVERQRRVNAALSEQFEAGLHALSIKAQAPGEG